MSRAISLIAGICLLVSTSSAQTSKTRFFCAYDEKNLGAELCKKIQASSFDSNKHAEKAVDSIVKPLGLRRNFVLVSCPKIDNAAAVTYDDGVRYIIYDNEFMERIDRGAQTDWASVAILAHEVGHHLQGHTTRLMHNPPTKEELQLSRSNEIEADEFSGFVMFKLGATLAQAKSAMSNLSDVDDEELSTHPKRSRRLKAIEEGYDNAKSQQPIENILNQQSAEEFFNKAHAFYEQKNYREAVDNYTVAIGLNPKFVDAYYHRGVTKHVGNDDYRGAMEDFTQAIRLDPAKEAAYFGRALVKYIGNKDYRGAIEDFTQAIRLNPVYSASYYWRAQIKEDAKDYGGAIADYSEAIRLDPEYSQAYFRRAELKSTLGDNAGACVDYRKSCRIGNADGCSAARKVCN